ncbi:MAG: beta-lactamase family protein [Acidobacteriota bacterium]|nr:beta-lactamase family protein [Acidobacteriota bacterium]
MLRRALLIVVFVLPAAACATGSANLDARLSATRDEHRVPGMSVVVMRGGDTVIARGYGHLEAGGERPVGAATVFQLGSISKQFLAALVMRLVEDGRLSLDDAVTMHLPEFTLLPAEVTVRRLLNHTSGMRELFAQEVYRGGIEDLSRGPEELARIARESPVDIAPGSRWSYTNTGYTTLALLVERVTGQPYEHALAARLFTPLGLASIRQCTPLPRDAHAGDEARGHVLGGGVVTVAAPENMHWIRGDGGLCGSAVDLARWTRLLHTGRVVSPASYAAMTAPTTVSSGGVAAYGFGLSLIEPDARRKIAHGGAMLGYSAMAAWYPDDELTVVVLTNRGDAGADAIERRLARRVLRLPEPARAPVALPLAERERLLGTYDIGVFDVVIADRDGDLWIESPRPGPTMKLTHVGSGRFIGADAPDSIEVVFGANGIRLMMGAMRWDGVRRDTVLPTSR